MNRRMLFAGLVGTLIAGAAVGNVGWAEQAARATAEQARPAIIKAHNEALKKETAPIAAAQT